MKPDWTTEAEGMLATIWLGAPDRNLVALAQEHVDALLSADPLRNSVEVAEGLRKLAVHPLQVFFHLQDDGNVLVTQVYYHPLLSQ